MECLLSLCQASESTLSPELFPNISNGRRVVLIKNSVVFSLAYFNGEWCVFRTLTTSRIRSTWILTCH